MSVYVVIGNSPDGTEKLSGTVSKRIVDLDASDSFAWFAAFPHSHMLFGVGKTQLTRDIRKDAFEQKHWWIDLSNRLIIQPGFRFAL